MTGPTTARVVSNCSGGDASRSDYVIPDSTRFTASHETGGESSARCCPQARLPCPWRDNDMSELTD